MVFDGVDEIDAIGPVSVLRRAGVDARIVTAAPVTSITGANGVEVRTDGVLEPGAADVLLVPGGGWAQRHDVGAYGEVQRHIWDELLREAQGTTPLLATVCTGALVLASVCDVVGRRMSTHASARDDLAELGVNVATDRVVDDGDLISCGGVTSGIDLALWLIDREMSTKLADTVASRLEYERFRPVRTR